MKKYGNMIALIGLTFILVFGVRVMRDWLISGWDAARGEAMLFFALCAVAGVAALVVRLIKR